MPEADLWIAVLERSYLDATRGSEPARHYLASDACEIAEMLGVDRDAWRRIIDTAAQAGWPRYNRRAQHSHR